MTNKSWYPMLMIVYAEVATLTKAINLSLVKIESSLYHCIIVNDVNVKSMWWKIHHNFFLMLHSWFVHFWVFLGHKLRLKRYSTLLVYSPICSIIGCECKI
jgi:uncharacterized membrane protein YczE